MKGLAWLGGISKEDADVAGGKGAQLGELKKAGFNVPDGFVITTSIYKEIITSLRARIEQELSELDVENTVALDEASTKIRKMIVFTKFAAPFEKEIIEAYRKLGEKVAVRSSATAEDQKDASFAGQMATFLNVTEHNLIDSIKNCLSSMFTARAISYRAKRGMGHTKVLISVVVQKMIAPKIAGVAFSVNPVSNNEKEIVIEAAAGLGEAVVSGGTTPDNYILEKQTGKLKSGRPGKESLLLDEREIGRLAEAVNAIERHYSFPQDIEWAIDKNDGLHILQARPVTTFERKKRTVWKKIIAREYGVQYTELSLKCLSPLNNEIVPSPFYEQAYIPENANEACYVDEEKWNGFVSALKQKYVENPDNYETFENQFIQAGKSYMETAKALAEEKLSEKSNTELAGLYQTYLKRNREYAPFIWMQFLINNFFAEKAKEIITEKAGKENKNIFEYIEVALKPEKKAAAMQLSGIAANWEILNENERAEVYERFKWMPCLDIHNKPWTKEEFFSHINEFGKAEKKLPMAYEALLNELQLPQNEEQTLGIARRLAYLKDLKDDFRRQGIFHSQKLFEEIAGRMGLSLEGISYATEEELVAFLKQGKALAGTETEERRKGFAIYFNADKEIECKSGQDIEAALNTLGLILFEDFSEEIKGMPASPGRAKGSVIIVRGVADLKKVKKGDIIVAVTTHPDYVPAMQKAAAIVTDEGGITSHAAIVARELGLPCVVGTKNATKILKDGDEIEIDAELGVLGKIKK
ncbi:MAG: PEP/pyruvate-binding domain-containing protein [Candidatus Woesearchaeota archaeon]